MFSLSAQIFVFVLVTFQQSDRTTTDLTKILEEYGLQAAAGQSNVNLVQSVVKDNLGNYSVNRRAVSRSLPSINVRSFPFPLPHSLIQPLHLAWDIRPQSNYSPLYPVLSFGLWPLLRPMSDPTPSALSSLFSTRS